jgi:hypothetical protein
LADRIAGGAGPAGRLRLVVYHLGVAEKGSFPIMLLALVYWCLGLLAGAAAGAVASLLLARDVRIGNAFKDGLAGAVGFLAGMAGVALMRVEPRTVLYYSKGSVVTTTTFRYQHPYPVAFAAAILLAVLRELFLFWRARRDCAARVVPQSKQT